MNLNFTLYDMVHGDRYQGKSSVHTISFYKDVSVCIISEILAWLYN